MIPLKDQISKVADNITVDAMGITTGFPSLDVQLRGYTKGELTLIAGRSSMGKTALMVDCALATSQKYNTGIFSLEMSAGQLIERMIVNKQNCSLYDLKAGEAEVTSETTEYLKSLNLWINDRSGISVLDITTIITKFDTKFDIIFIDYLQLVRSYSGKVNRYEEVDKVCQSLRDFAKTNNIAVVLLCQLNREVEKRENHKPRLSDLRESGGIEQTADKILMLYRPAYYKLYEQSNADKDAVDDGEGHIIIAKNRNGSLGDIPVVWLAEQMSYRSCNFTLSEEF